MKIISIVMFALLPCICIAGVWTPAKTISEIREYGNGIAVYGHDLGNASIPCSNRSAAMPPTSATVEQINRFNSTILAAYMANKPIILKISDNACSGDYPVYYGLRLK